MSGHSFHSLQYEFFGCLGQQRVHGFPVDRFFPYFQENWHGKGRHMREFSMRDSSTYTGKKFPQTRDIQKSFRGIVPGCLEQYVVWFMGT